MNTHPHPHAVILRLARLALPVIGLNVLNVLALAVDTAMVARLDAPEAALTGLGFGTQFLFILMVLMIGLSVGSVAIVARAYGAGDLQRVNEQLAQSTLLTIILGLGAGFAGRALAPYYLDVVAAQGPAREAALTYLEPLLYGLVFNYLTILLGSTLRGVGNTRLAFQVALVSNLANFAFNGVLIFGRWGLPALGVQGAALGTLLSQALGLALILGALARGAVPGVRAPLRWVPIDPKAAAALLRVGAPAALDMVVLNAGFLSIVSLLGRIDPVAVAAHGIGLRIQALAFVPGMAISQATGALVGNALGAGRPDEARAIARASVTLCVTVMTVIPLVLVLPSDAVLRLFDVDADSALGAHATTWMRILGLCMPLAGVHVALAGAFQGAGATPLSLRQNMASTLLVQIPTSALLGLCTDLGALGVWLGFPAGFILRSTLATLAFRGEGWLRVRVR